MTNTIFYLFGFAGVGKYTIAKEIAAVTGATIVDNHLINNPVFSVIGADGIKPLPFGVWREVKFVRDAVLNAVCYIAPKENSFIFTNELFDIEGDKKLFESVLAVAEERGSIFVPIRLLCELKELQKRIVSSERTARFKQIDAGAVSEKYGKYSVLKPRHDNLIEIDVTQLSAKEAASIILEKANGSPPSRG